MQSNDDRIGKLRVTPEQKAFMRRLMNRYSFLTSYQSCFNFILQQYQEKIEGDLDDEEPNLLRPDPAPRIDDDRFDDEDEADEVNSLDDFMST